MSIPKLLSWMAVACLHLTAFPQNTFYVAAKAGLNLREKPDIHSPVVAKIAYGEKLSKADHADYGLLQTEGMSSKWIMLTDGTHKGYAADVYLLPFSPPKEKIKSLKDYLATLSKVQSTVKTGNGAPSQDEQLSTTKTVYANGTVLREVTGWESYSETIWMPNINIYQAFVLARLLCQNARLLNIQDGFPQKAVPQSTPESREIKIFRLYENFDVPALIRIDVCDGACHFIEIHEEDGEVSITFASQV